MELLTMIRMDVQNRMATKGQKPCDWTIRLSGTFFNQVVEEIATYNPGFPIAGMDKFVYSLGASGNLHFYKADDCLGVEIIEIVNATVIK